MLPSVYIETTIPSYLTAWPSGDLIRAGHQKVTRDWWASRRGDFTLYISQLVLDEAGDGDEAAAADRLRALDEIPLVPATEQSGELAELLLSKVPLPAKAAVDAAHIASRLRQHGFPADVELQAHQQRRTGTRARGGVP